MQALSVLIMVGLVIISGCGTGDDSPAQFVEDRYYTGDGYWQVIEVYFDKTPQDLVVENALEYHLGEYPILDVILTIYPSCNRASEFVSVTWSGGKKRFRCVRKPG